jgi:hypothetical protein
MWEREPSLPEVIEDAWKEGKMVRDLGDIAGNFHEVMASLE